MNLSPLTPSLPPIPILPSLHPFLSPSHSFSALFLLNWSVKLIKKDKFLILSEINDWIQHSRHIMSPGRSVPLRQYSRGSCARLCGATATRTLAAAAASAESHLAERCRPESSFFVDAHFLTLSLMINALIYTDLLPRAPFVTADGY